MVKIKGKIKEYGFLIVACLLMAVCVISGTMAKFASSSDGSGLKITVATWNVEVEGTTLGSIDGDGNPVKIDLSGLAWQILWRESDNIAASLNTPDNACAPGTWGYAPITIENKGGVPAAVTVTETTGANTFLPEKSTPQDKDDPGRSSSGLNFGVTKEDITSSTDGPDDFKGISDLGEIVVPAGEKVTIYVYYVWELAEGTNDAQDTALGNAQDWFDFGQLTFTAVQAKNVGSTD